MIIDAIKRHNEKEQTSFHMPGHKKGAGFVGTPLNSSVFAYDTTELCDTDALIAPQKEILAAEQRAAEIYGAAHSFFLVNGATVGILTMMYATFSKGDVVLVDRNCHQSVINGAILSGILPVYITPEPSKLHNVPGVVSPESVRKALKKYPNAKGLVLTSPNYYGKTANLSELADLIHNVGALLLVDEAHGAHFPFSKHFPKSAMVQGADMSVTSLHKSLAAPNQTALLHIASNISKEKVRCVLRMFQTSSPSYIFLAAMEQALEEGANRGAWLTEQTLKRLSLLNCPTLDDPFKLLPDFRAKGLTGEEVDEIFREKFGIYAEMVTAHGLLLMASWYNEEADFKRLKKALDYCSSLPDVANECPDGIGVDESVVAASFPLSVFQQRDKKQILLNAAEGYLCGAAISAFPPCIPIIMPGERITKEKIDKVLSLQEKGATITGLAGNLVTVCVDE